VTTHEDELNMGSSVSCYQTLNQRVFNRVLRRYVQISEQALVCAANHLYHVKNRTRRSKGSEFLADVERITKRALGPALWSVFCDIALFEAGREHAEVSPTDYAIVTELAGQAYINAGLEPHKYFRFTRIRQLVEVNL
jgi:hypothetical protein